MEEQAIQQEVVKPEVKNTIPDWIRVHDCVYIIKRQTWQGESTWRGHKRIALVVGIGENTLTLANPDGEIFDYDTNNDNDSKEGYETIFEVASEILFENEIKKELKSQIEYAQKQLEKVDSTEEWLSKFKNQISFFGRLARFVKENAPWKN